MHVNRINITEQNDSFINIPANDNVVFFDIETSGFSASHSIVYLIGCIYSENNQFHLIQWLLEEDKDEPLLLHEFFNFIRPYQTLVHFNGEGFDMPFLLSRCVAACLPYNFDNYKSIDLYKCIAPYKKHLKLSNIKQKTLESFLSVDRDDTCDGRELINLYHEYRKQPAKELSNMLLLHNHDDLTGMLKLLPLLSYPALFQGSVNVDGMEITSYENDCGELSFEAVFSFHCNTPVPKRISYGHDDFYLICTPVDGKLRVKVYTQELKFFFKNYKDYYYLPVEDTAIHKSISFYVDKNYRTKAKAANCYSRRSGQFLPQFEPVISPFFKQDYHDQQTYFELTEDFVQDKEQQQLYLTHLLTHI